MKYEKYVFGVWNDLQNKIDFIFFNELLALVSLIAFKEFISINVFNLNAIFHSFFSSYFALHYLLKSCCDYNLLHSIVFINGNENENDLEQIELKNTVSSAWYIKLKELVPISWFLVAWRSAIGSPQLQMKPKRVTRWWKNEFK